MVLIVRQVANRFEFWGGPDTIKKSDLAVGDEVIVKTVCPSTNLLPFIRVELFRDSIDN